MLTVIAKVLKIILNVVVKVAAKIIYLTGLYMPLLYGVYVLILYAIYRFDLSVPSVEQTLFYIGLFTSIACGLVIFFKRITKPLDVFKRKTVKVRYEDNGDEHVNRRDKRNGLHDRNEEKPLIYWSELYPDTLVHEYSDRFKLYKRIHGELRLVRIEYKDDL